jgi:myb proto-oncogene protein
LDPRIALTGGSKGKWTAVEDIKLKDAVKTHGDKDWGAISLVVPGRTKSQCHSRWKDALDPSIDRANERTGKWTAVEDSKLEDAVQTHDYKDWAAISALVPGRTKIQCCHRWRDVLDPSIGRASGRKGKWTAFEDRKLKDAVQTYGFKNWVTIAEMVPGRTNKQCWDRWNLTLIPDIS